MSDKLKPCPFCDGKADIQLPSKEIINRKSVFILSEEVSEDCSDYYKGYCARREDGCFHQCKNAPTMKESEE